MLNITEKGSINQGLSFLINVQEMVLSIKFSMMSALLDRAFRTQGHL